MTRRGNIVFVHLNFTSPNLSALAQNKKKKKMCVFSLSHTHPDKIFSPQQKNAGCWSQAINQNTCEMFSSSHILFFIGINKSILFPPNLVKTPPNFAESIISLILIFIYKFIQIGKKEYNRNLKLRNTQLFI